MNDSIVKDIIKLKLKIADALLDKLPEGIRDEVGKLQSEFVEAVKKASEEYLEEKKAEKEEKELKSISID